MRDEQDAKSKLTAPETPEQEVKAEKDAQEKEELCVDLIKFTENLVYSSKETGKTLVASLDIVRRFFEDYLFASHYKQTE